MKKTIAMLLIASLLCFMTACGNAETQETEIAEESITESVSETVSETVSEETEAIVETPNTYTAELDNGVVIEMGVIADDTVASLGDPLSVAEAPSCVHEGNDVLYTFNGFTLTTSPDADGNARIQEIALISDAVSLKNGLSIGSDKATVESVLGTEYTDNFGVLTFTFEGATVAIVLDEDECVSGLVISAK